MEADTCHVFVDAVAARDVHVAGPKTDLVAADMTVVAGDPRKLVLEAGLGVSVHLYIPYFAKQT